MDIGNVILESFFQAKVRLEHEHYGRGRIEAHLREEIFIKAHRFLMSMPMGSTHIGGLHSRERFEYKGMMFFNNKYQLSFLGLERRRLIFPLAYIDTEQVIAFFMEANDYCQIPIFIIETGEVASHIPETPDSYEIDSSGGGVRGSLKDYSVERRLDDMPDHLKDFKVKFPDTWVPTLDEEAIKKLAEDAIKTKAAETKGASSLMDSLKIWKRYSK